MSMDFGSRLKVVREEKGLKREDVAKKIGTSGAIVGRYERNERTPNIDTKSGKQWLQVVTTQWMVRFT